MTTSILINAAVGIIAFLGGQLWGLGKVRYRERTLRRALENEIQELSPWLLRNLLTFECMIQLSCLGELSNNGPVPVPIQVYAEHFPEINLKLSRAKRASIISIYTIIFSINRSVEKIRELCPQCWRDPSNLHQLRIHLDNAFRNSRQALLIIHLHTQSIGGLETITTSDSTTELYDQMQAKNDSDLLRLAAEARKSGADAIRKKYHDGAASVSDVAPSPVPVPGNFYFDATGAKFKCLTVRGGNVRWMQLESQIGALTFDVELEQPLDSVRHRYEITDPDERARLERRYLQLMKNRSFRNAR